MARSARAAPAAAPAAIVLELPVAARRWARRAAWQWRAAASAAGGRGVHVCRGTHRAAHADLESGRRRGRRRRPGTTRSAAPPPAAAVFCTSRAATARRTRRGHGAEPFPALRPSRPPPPPPWRTCRRSSMRRSRGRPPRPPPKLHSSSASASAGAELAANMGAANGGAAASGGQRVGWPRGSLGGSLGDGVRLDGLDLEDLRGENYETVSACSRSRRRRVARAAAPRRWP